MKLHLSKLQNYYLLPLVIISFETSGCFSENVASKNRKQEKNVSNKESLLENDTNKNKEILSNQSKDSTDFLFESSLISLAEGHCARKHDGSLWCWGDLGVLGRFSRATKIENVPTNARSIAAGKNFLCWLTMAQDIQCMGAGDAGQLGNGRTLAESHPVRVVGNTKNRRFSTIWAGGTSVCANLLDSEKTLCWGKGMGEKSTNQLVPRPLSELSKVKQMSLSYLSFCALIPTEDFLTAYCSGENQHGQTGDRTREFHSSFTPMAKSIPIKDLSQGGNHTCIIQNPEEKTYCFGSNAHNQLGGNVTPENALDFHEFITNQPATKIVAGIDRTCVVTKSRDLICAGNNADGQLSDALLLNNEAPQIIASGVNSVSFSDRSTCISLEDGHVQCTGNNSHYELGDGSSLSRNHFSEVVTTDGKAFQI